MFLPSISHKERIQHLYIGNEGIQSTDLVAIKVTHRCEVLIQNPSMSLASIVQMQRNIAQPVDYVLDIDLYPGFWMSTSQRCVTLMATRSDDWIPSFPM